MTRTHRFYSNILQPHFSELWTLGRYCSLGTVFPFEVRSHPYAVLSKSTYVSDRFSGLFLRGVQRFFGVKAFSEAVWLELAGRII